MPLEELKSGSKISFITFQRNSATTVNYMSYRLYEEDVFSEIILSLKNRYLQSLKSNLLWEDSLGAAKGLPKGACRGLHLITGNRTEIRNIVNCPAVQEAFRDPNSYIHLEIDEHRICTKASFRRPSREGATAVLDLIKVSKERFPKL